jgi:hypothetical protein
MRERERDREERSIVTVQTVVMSVPVILPVKGLNVAGLNNYFFFIGGGVNCP